MSGQLSDVLSTFHPVSNTPRSAAVVGAVDCSSLAGFPMSLTLLVCWLAAIVGWPALGRLASLFQQAFEEAALLEDWLGGCRCERTCSKCHSWSK